MVTYICNCLVHCRACTWAWLSGARSCSPNDVHNIIWLQLNMHVLLTHARTTMSCIYLVVYSGNKSIRLAMYYLTMHNRFNQLCMNWSVNYPFVSDKTLLFPTDSTRLSDSPYQLQVRLAEGSYPSQGRVEVYCNGQWGTICATSRFGSTEAETVCRQLGYTDASRYNHLYLWVTFLHRQTGR